MVANIPDPPQEESPVTESIHINAMPGNDSDEEDRHGHEGYTMLPTDMNDVDDIHEIENDSEPEEGNYRDSPSPPPVEPSTFEKATAQEVSALWSEPTSKKEDLTPDLKEEVLNAMKGFTLPSSAIPAWANEIGEEDWKNHLLDKIRNNK